MNSFQSKTVLVTGGSSGIGRAAALAFARAGANVVIAARGAERGVEAVRAIEDAGGRALFIRTDVSRPAEVAAMVEQTIASFGRLDCAFNNAAEVHRFALTGDYSEDEFDRAVAANLKSVWLCMKEEIQQMLRQDPPGGAIVNTSSVNGLGGVAQGSLYAMAKAGVLGLTKSAALEYAGRGIRVNALVAGAFRTPMLMGVLDTMSGGDPERRKAIEAQYSQFIAQGRIGDPAEAAQSVLWLCSEAASYVTGLSLIVDGGMTSLFR